VSDDERDQDKRVYWEKVTAIATVATLIMSTLIGFFGVYLGSKAVRLSGEVASAQMRPLLQGERVWYGAGGGTGFTIENNGFGPLHIRQSVYVRFDDKGAVEESLVIGPETNAEDILSFLKLKVFINDKRITVGVPSIGTALGVDRKMPIIQVGDNQKRIQFFHALNEKSFERAVRNLGVCIVYDALDKRRQLFSEKGACEALKITKRKIRLKKS